MTEQMHKTLAAALLAFQQEVPTLKKDATNPHFKSKFVSLDRIVETAGPVLQKHGLVWATLPCFGPNGEPALRYMLTHGPSGDSISDTMPLLLAKNDPQGQGSAITYARRYSMTAVLNLVADEDDDGQKASAPRAAPKQSAPKPQELDPDIVDLLRQKFALAAWDSNRLKLHLTAVGVQDVSVLTRAVRHLTPKQAEELDEALNDAIKAREKAAAKK